jgi:hypothetical protein
MVLAEWQFVLSVTPAQAEHELQHWLVSGLAETGK